MRTVRPTASTISTFAVVLAVQMAALAGCPSTDGGNDQTTSGVGSEASSSDAAISDAGASFIGDGHAPWAGTKLLSYSDWPSVAHARGILETPPAGCDPDAGVMLRPQRAVDFTIFELAPNEPALGIRWKCFATSPAGDSQATHLYIVRDASPDGGGRKGEVVFDSVVESKVKRLATNDQIERTSDFSLVKVPDAGHSYVTLDTTTTITSLQLDSGRSATSTVSPRRTFVWNGKKYAPPLR